MVDVARLSDRYEQEHERVAHAGRPVARSCQRAKRCDIVMRERFVQYYRTNRAAYEQDRRGFAARVRELPYYRFFVGIPSASASLTRQYPSETRDPLFARKVEAFIEMINALDQRGYDKSRPIKLKYHVRGPARGTLSIGSGCHRLSILRATRGRLLDGDYFSTKPLLSSRIRDNTATLIAKGLLLNDEIEELEASLRRVADEVSYGVR